MTSETLPVPADPPQRSPLVRAARIGLGLALLAAGVAMLVLPGPGLAAMAGGLWIVGDDIGWARRARLRLLAVLEQARARLDR